MTNIIRLMHKHWMVFCIALVVGVCSSFPQYTTTRYIPNFQGIYRGVVDDMLYYEVRSKDIIDGHSFLTNPYIAEHKIGLSMPFWLPDYIIAKPISWFHLSVPIGFIWWTFFLTILLTFFCYSVLFLLTSRRDLSIMSVIFLNISLFGSDFLRLPSPGFNFVFWLGTLLCLLLFIQTKKKRYVIFTTIFFGMLFHLSPYFWTFYVVLFILFLSLCFIFKVDVQYKKYIYIYLGAFMIGVPYFFLSWQISKISTYSEMLRRVGVINTHFPSGIESVFFALIIISAYYVAYKKEIIKSDETSILMLAGLLTSIIVVNQHIFTGSNAEFSSHYFLPDLFWALLACVFLCKKWLDSGFLLVRTSQIYIIFFVVLFFGVVSLQSMVKRQILYSNDDLYAQHYAPIFDWLNKHSVPESVVYANDDVESYLPIYVSDNVYYSPDALFFPVSDIEVNNRFIINHYFDKFTSEYVLEKQRMIFGAYYINQYNHNLSKNKLRKVFGLPQVQYQLVPDVEINKIISLANIIQKNDFEKEIKTYKVDYLIWDTFRDPQWKIDQQKFLVKVYSANGIVIYRVN